jgi:hypothetical protein
LKKTKKVVKKIVVTEVRRIPSAIDDDMIVEPSHKGFFSHLWSELKFNIRRHRTPGSENEFVDVQNFSDDMAEVQKEVIARVAAVAADEVAGSRPPDSQDQASPKFVKELEMMFIGEGVLCKMLHLLRLTKIFPKTKTLLCDAPGF